MQADIKTGQADLFHACRQSLAHGVLLALHYLAPLVPWAGAVGDQGHAAVMRPWLQGLLQLLEEASELALQPLSKPQDSNIGKDHTHNPDSWPRLSHNPLLHQDALLRTPAALYPLAFRQEEETWMAHKKLVGQGHV